MTMAQEGDRVTGAMDKGYNPIPVAVGVLIGGS
jgi:hypothetical protein